MSTANFRELEHDLPFYVLDTSELDEWDQSDIYDQVSSWLNQVNDEELNLFELSIISGYYTGLQLFAQVRPHRSRYTYSGSELEDFDDEDSYCLFGYEDHNELMLVYEKERQYIAQLFEQVAADYGFIHIRCIGHFSNGEALYEEAK